MPAGSHFEGRYVWDASALHHPGKAGRLDILGSYVKGPTDAPWRHCTTDVVASELSLHGIDVPDWCDIVPLDELSEVIAYGAWTSVLAAGSYGLGESSVAAWAEIHGDVAIVDDRAAKAVINQHGLAVHGSVWLLCEAIKIGRVDVTSVSSFLDACLAVGAWLPFQRFGFRAWATTQGLL